MRLSRLVLLLVLGVIIHKSSYAAENSNKVFTFGVVPQQSAQVLAKKWLPILKYISAETGYKFVFKTTNSIPSFEEKLVGSEYDFAYMNPYHYTVFHDNPGYSAILKQGGKQIRGILVTHKDSKIDSLKELQNHVLAFPAPAAFAATVIPQAIISGEGIKHESKYVSSHESVYKNVAYRNFVAGGGIERTFDNTSEAIRSQIKVFWKSRGYTPHAFAVSPKVPAEIRNSVVKAFMSMNDSEVGKQLLYGLKFKYIEKAKNSDWDDVRQLDIRLLENLTKVSG